jgi:aryl-alcohol dehydrogenase-like predicted oxidoreductase
MVQALSLDTYRLLGRSGLRVSPLALGTITFGGGPGWGTDANETRRILDEYIGRGGNFIDTANQYTDGAAEELIGAHTAERREQLVIATKFSLATRPGDPNSGGNHRRSMVRSVESSLRRLKTDYIDLLYLHFWDATTPEDEILRAMDDLVRSGKVLYLGVSDTPAWRISAMQAIAALRGWSVFIALQMEYNLLERTGERELIPMSRTHGLGIIPWSPLAGGVLSGKYSRADLIPRSDEASVRKTLALDSGALCERSLAITDVVKQVADEIGKSTAQVALAWTLTNPAVTSSVIGARTLEQFRENLRALDVELTNEHLARLRDVSFVPLGFPHDFLRRLRATNFMYGGAKIVARDE